MQAALEAATAARFRHITIHASCRHGTLPFGAAAASRYAANCRHCTPPFKLPPLHAALQVAATARLASSC
jgi:hypothetical protein